MTPTQIAIASHATIVRTGDGSGATGTGSGGGAAISSVVDSRSSNIMVSPAPWLIRKRPTAILLRRASKKIT
jgi:hypothetical protein